MDLYITIRDENSKVLETVNIYEDGSDAEGAKEIRDWIEDNYRTEPYPDAPIKLKGGINWEARNEQIHEANEANKGTPPEGQPLF